MQTSNDLVGFIENQKTYNDFREYIKALLSTFMSEEYLKIYMSDEMLPRVNRRHVTKGYPETEEVPAKGPFEIIKRAFTHAFVSSVNLESLETLGDGVLNETVVMIIVGNWPNLLTQAGQVANMKKYHTNNVNIAKYAEQIGFVKWVVRDRRAGLNGKERADVFESFIGALVLIGEFYIGEQMGLAIARLFLNKFFAQQEWHPENPEFYESAENLWNDWKTSLSLRPPQLKKIPHYDEDSDVWTMTLRASDSEGREKGPIELRTGKKSLSFTRSARNKEDAEGLAFRELTDELKLRRADINTQRRQKQELNPEMKVEVDRLEKYAASLDPPREVKIPARKMRGGISYVFIKEVKHAQLGSRTLTYEATVASGWAEGENQEVKAMKNAVTNFIAKAEWTSIAGTEEEYNPDEITDNIKVSAEVPCKEKPKSGQGKSRHEGKSSQGRGSSKPRSEKPTGRTYHDQEPQAPKPAGRGRGTTSGRGRGRGSKPESTHKPVNTDGW